MKPVRTWFEEKEFCTTKYLYSLNHWHGRPLAVYLDYKKQWRKVLTGSVFLWGRAKGKRFLSVRRIVRSANHLIKDRDNLEGAVKPIKDLLVSEGVLLEDEDSHVRFEISQEVGKVEHVRIFVEDLNERE